MAPSKESEYLVKTFKQIVEKGPPDNDPFKQRANYDTLQQAATEPPEITYEDVDLPGPSRGPARWVRPLNASKKHVIVFMHGGGYSFGSLDSHRKVCAHFARACNAWALMVDYRMTPEHPYPAAINDCVAAYKWLLDQGFEAKHIVTMGDSCGGGLATAVPLKAISEDLPAPGAAVALSPWYDAVGQDSESIRTNAKNDVLSTPETLALLRERYVTAAGADPRDPFISPIYASDTELSKMPPHWISCAGHDALLNDGTRMAEKLDKAGVETVLKVHESMQHVFEFMAGRAPESTQSVKEIGEWVRKKIGS